MKTLMAFLKRHWRRILIGFAALIGLSIIGFAVWFIFPMKRAQLADILPDSPFAYITLPIDKSDPAVAGIVDAFKKRLAGHGQGALRKLLINLALPAALPESVMVILASMPDAPQSEILVVARVGKLSRLLRLFGGTVNKALLRGGPVSTERVNGHRFSYRSDAKGGFSPSAYTLIDDTLVMGTGVAAVKECYENYRDGGLRDEESVGFVSLLEHALEQKDVVLYVGNFGDGMTRLVNEASDKYSFAAFPTMDSVAGITGTIRLFPGKISGSALFVTKWNGAMEGVHSDVKFLYGAFKRVAKASGIDMSGEVADSASDVLFEFELKDYLRALSGDSTEPEGE
jgi:hypothetical protein